MSEVIDTNRLDDVPTRKIAGLLAEFGSEAALVEAAKKVKEAGYTVWDTHSPYPIHGIDHAMGLKPTVLPWFTLVAGLTGCTAALALQFWTNGIDYPWNISGKPLFSVPANVPIMFELGVLFAALTTFFGVHLLNGLPTFFNPLFASERFKKVSDDKFFLTIDARDPKFSERTTAEFVQSLHGDAAEVLYLPAQEQPVPRWVNHAVWTALVLSLIPMAYVWKLRYTPSREPRIHIVQDMDNQPRFKPQQVNEYFSDTRAARLPAAGTVARGELYADQAFVTGQKDGQYLAVAPVEATAERLARGRERYNIYCSVCHGYDGAGQGMVAVRAAALAAAGETSLWVPPVSYHSDAIRSAPDGHLYNVITNGVRKMAGYGSQIKPEDRWAIVLYVRALQRSQLGKIEEVPADKRPAVR